MRYALMRKMDISNGTGIGASLFVQGCRFHCKNCFNQETWDFNGGNEWDKQAKEKFMNLVSQQYVTRVSILGGEPLEKENIEEVYELIVEIRNTFPNKSIWLYTGYQIDKIIDRQQYRKIIELCDIIVDGAYIDELKDITLPFMGSSNQRVIDVQGTLEQGRVVLWQKGDLKIN